MLICSTCSYESPDGAKFCRQCGGPLFAESETTGAATRNYGRQASAPAVSAPLPSSMAPNVPPSVIDAFGSDTSRYYQPPQSPVHAAAHLYPQHVPNTSSLKSPPSRLRWLLLFAVLLVGMGFGVAFQKRADRRPRLTPVEYERLERMRVADRIRGTLTESINGAAGRSVQELQKHLQRIESFVRTSEATKARPDRVVGSLPGFQTIDLREYEYPQSAVSHSIRLPGAELLKQTTQDSAETVGQFYQQKLGQPLARAEEGEKTWLLFQAQSSPAVTVLVKQIEVRNVRRPRRNNSNEPEPGSLEITVLNAPFAIPRLTPPEIKPEAQPEAGAGQSETKKPSVNPVTAQPKQSAAIPR
jgi:hypothetical protein